MGPLVAACLPDNPPAHSRGQDQYSLKGGPENPISLRPLLAYGSTLTPGSSLGSGRVEDGAAPPERCWFTPAIHPRSLE